MTTNDHDCVRRVNEELKVHNTQIGWALSLGNPGRELIPVATIKADSSVRKKPMALYATYCPFCGNKLEGA